MSVSMLSGENEGAIVKPVSRVKPVDTSDSSRRRTGGASSNAPPTKRSKGSQLPV